MATVQLTGDWMQSVGNRKAVSGTITMSDSYAAGGESVAPADIGLGVIDHMALSVADSVGNAVLSVVAAYDKDSAKVKLFETGTVVDLNLVEVDDADDHSSTVIDFWAIGV